MEPTNNRIDLSHITPEEKDARPVDVDDFASVIVRLAQAFRDAGLVMGERKTS
jgi:hypothetical protein